PAHAEAPPERDPRSRRALRFAGKRACGVRWIVRTPCRGRQKPARQTLRPWAATVRCAANGSPQSDALRLRQVCRAGFAGRGTPSALPTGAPLSLSVPGPRQSLGSVRLEVDERAVADRHLGLGDRGDG